MITPDDITKNLQKIYDGETNLDMLIEFEGVLDNLHLYAYKNWFKGEIIEGPEISRYWIEVSLLYPYEHMPDPEGALRLTKVGCHVHFVKQRMKLSVDIKDPDDLEMTKDGKRKPKKVVVPVWIVQIAMPRQFISEFASEKIKLNGVDIDLGDVIDAKDENLDSTRDDDNDDTFEEFLG
jgi:hypothetical protein